MTPKPLREQLARFEQPVDVDTLRWEVDSAVRAVEGHRDALKQRVRHLGQRLAEAVEAAQARAEEVRRIDGKTRGGFVGTMLSSMNSEGVAEVREKASYKLSGDLSVLEARIEDCKALAQQGPKLAEDARFGAGVFEGLRVRAVKGGLDSPLVGLIADASARMAAIPESIAGFAASLASPLQGAEVVARDAAQALGRLRSTERASTVGEALLDGIVSPGSGAVGQFARKKAQEAAPGLIPELERDASPAARARMEIEREREEARQRARRDAEARRAAEAELDALEWDS